VKNLQLFRLPLIEASLTYILAGKFLFHAMFVFSVKRRDARGVAFSSNRGDPRSIAGPRTRVISKMNFLFGHHVTTATTFATSPTVHGIPSTRE
jgi:hypothetical protein